MTGSFLLVVALAAAQASPSAESIRAVLGADSSRWLPAVHALYAERGFRPLWSESGEPTPGSRALLRELTHAEDRGLRAADYRVEGIDSRGVAPDAVTDVALSAAALRFVTDVSVGRVDPATLGIQLDVARLPHDPLPSLRALAAARTPSAAAVVLDALEPPWRRFALLKRALARYRLLAASRDFPSALPAPPAWDLREGDEYAGTPQLRRLLVALGDLSDADAASNEALLLDAGLTAGLRTFQSRHALRTTGVLDADTYAALRIPIATRVLQLELAMERFRTLPPRLDTPPLVVNLPQFKLFAFYTPEDREDEILTIDVIVGKAFGDYGTPLLAADMTHVVFRPYWDVPHGILTRELLPQIVADQTWLTRNGYEIVLLGSPVSVTQVASPEAIEALADGRARLRQRPGPANALGRIKFVFPNRHSVLLHDTPTTALFAEARRAFSHGCIRVADPVALARYVLRETPSWTPEAIVAAMERSDGRRVDLARPIRVFLIYSTALVAEDGTVYFFEDLYGHDGRLAAALQARR